VVAELKKTLGPVGSDMITKFLERKGIIIDVTPGTERNQMIKTGMAEWKVDLLMQFNSALREGYASQVTDTVESLTGKPARTFDQFASEHTHLFKGA